MLLDYSNEKSKCPYSVRFAEKEKYPNRVMVWVAISNRCIATISSEAVDSDIYINECLEKRLLPFILEHHPDSNYVLCPDLDGCHYSKQTVALVDENVNFVPKDIYPPNVSQARPIENF